MKNPSFITVLLLFFFIAVPPRNLFAQEAFPKFKHLTTIDGLSQNHVSAIIKDSKGFMWFATDEGLNRYDGYNFTVFKYDAERSTSISNNYVYDILEGFNGILWVGTADGLNMFDRQKDVFVHYLTGNNTTVRHIFQDSKKRIWLGTSKGLFLLDAQTGSCKLYRDSKNPNDTETDFIYRIAEDNYGELWIASQGGLSRFNPLTGIFQQYKNEPGNSNTIGSNWIKTVYKDSRGNIWAGTQGSGIAVFNRANNSFTNYIHNAADAKSISHNDILCLAQSNDGRLWVGTENGGISVFDYAQNNFTALQSKTGDDNSLTNNSVYCLYKDDIGNMWAGTWSGGINLLPRYGEKFRHYSQIPSDRTSLSSNIILSIAGDSSTGNIWIGTDGGGLNCFNKSTQQFSHYVHDDKNKNSVSSDYVLSIVEIEPGLLCIGYHRGGFDLYNTKTGVFTHYLPEKNRLNTLSARSVNVVIKDHSGKLWLGTWGGGLNVYDRKTKRFTLYHHSTGDSNSISSNFIHSLMEDSKGNILIGTETGLDILDIKKNCFTNYHNEPGNRQSLSNNMVESLLQDHLGKIWVGTAGGLNLFNEKNKNFIAYTEKDGLANNLISAIAEDKSGDLWLSSNQGLTRFNPTSKTCRNYSTADGLQGNAFKARCVYREPGGAMFFGGANGFNLFHPDSLRDNDFIAPVFITDFQLFNKRIVPGSNNSILQQDISVTKQINLSYRQSVFTFEFAALNYTLPEKNQYSYKLEGFDKDWTQVSGKRTATYTNLDGGEYIFRVIGSNNDGVWNKVGTSVKIIITPPWWLTWWCKVLFLVCVSGSAFAFYKYRINIINAQKRKLQRLVNEQTHQLVVVNEAERQARLDAEKSKLEADDANKAKSIFLATMSHEIRTPMNGVIGMASLLHQTEMSHEQKGYVESISNCGESLLNVINDILDFSKIESGNMELECRDFDLRTNIEEVLDLFAAKALQTGLDLVYEIDTRVPAQIKGDSLRIRQVLMNLVGNAIKFTKHGEIVVKVRLENTSATGELKILFEVKDTGIGIPPDKMKHLFKAFSQVDSSTTRKYGGTGLGLVICEKLVALMGGEITAASTPGQGATFTFNLKVMPGLNAERIYPAYNMNVVEGKRLLVVDDNTTNRRVLQNQLNAWKMTATLASSGSEALALLSVTAPFDLVLTDLRMPEMDGIELSLQIRKNYPDLPVILLSSTGDNYWKEHPDLFSAVLTKPTRQHMLSRSILNALQQPGLTPLVEEQKNIEKLSVGFAQKYPLKLLVAEDNLINQQLILKILSILGYVPSLAENGLEVLDLLIINSYDVILMDVQMPEMDGLETTRNIRKKDQKQPVIIAMTANAMQGDQEECFNAGMNDYLSKPVIINDLLNMLNKWANHISMEAELVK